MTDLQVGRAYPDTIRVKFTNDPRLQPIIPAINGNQEALKALQEIVSYLEVRVAKLEAAAPSEKRKDEG